jgi:hypothetical protein
MKRWIEKSLIEIGLIAGSFMSVPTGRLKSRGRK